MEKLIELLDEFRKAEGYRGGLVYGPFGARQGDLNFIFNHTKFPFIKWLVENKKIEEGTLPLSYESILMQLAISDNPLGDLVWLLEETEEY